MSKELFNKFASFNGAKFIGVNGYKNQHGEISNQILNVNVDIRKAKESDLVTLSKITEKQLRVVAKQVNVGFEVARRALKEMIHSAERNLSNDNKTAQSEAQNDAYISLGKGLRLHKDSMEVYVSGFANSKRVLVEGEYPSTNKQAKTLVKDVIKEGLKMSKFRNFKLGKADALTITGDTIYLG